MAWLTSALAQFRLARSADALLRGSGPAPRTVRGMTLDPQLQLIEARTRKRAILWEDMTLDRVRARVAALASAYGGRPVGGVRTQQVMAPGRNRSVPGLLYLPQVRDNNAIMLVYYHAGGGVAGSARDCARLCGLIAKIAGAPVLSVDYRLAPEHRFPRGLEDAIHAYQWSVENASRYGAPVRRAAVGGDGIGGAFAAIVAQEMRATRTPPVLQLLITPLLDFISDAPSMIDFADAFPLTSDALAFYMSRYLPDDVEASDPRVSPARTQDLEGLAPALVYTAGFDMTLDQTEDYADRMAQAGVKLIRRYRFPSLCHGYTALPAATPAAEAAIKRIARETAEALKTLH